MAVYYIDLIHGNKDSKGLETDNPRLTYREIDLQSGDTVLFKRGNFVRDVLTTKGGNFDAPIIYGAYGEGEKPVFCGSIDVSNPDCWIEIKENIWECQKEIPTEVCNFIYNSGEICGALRWETNDLCEQGDFWDNRFGCSEGHIAFNDKQCVLLFSEKNPSKYYSHIECVIFGQRNMAVITSNIIIEDISFENSGVHGFSGAGHDIKIRRCDFRFIGGCVWDKNLRIRFGNGVEFWNVAENVNVEDCFFYNIYDSCVTHQGSDKCKPALNVQFKNNLFIKYGMAAYECRDVLPINTCFNNNICVDAGEGFSKLGEAMPRKSEIWPLPMGHHVFLWRIPINTENGNLEIKGNIFYNAPFGAAVYSIISMEAEAQINIDNNFYYTVNDKLLNRFANQDFVDFSTYCKSTGCDKNSEFKEPDINKIINEWMEKFMNGGAFIYNFD